MNREPFVINPSDCPRPLQVVGEEITVLAPGEVTFGIGDETRRLQRGSLVHLPAGSTHCFRFGPGGGEMVSINSRLAASRMFADIDRQIAPEAPDLAQRVAIGARHGLELRA